MAGTKRTKVVPKQNFIGRFLANLQSLKEKKEALTEYSIASDDLTEIAFTDSTYFQKADGKKQLEILYRNNWAVKKCISVRASMMSFRGLKIVCKTNKAKGVIDKFLRRMHPTRPMLALQQSFRNRSINADIFPFAADELLFTPAGTKEKPADPEKAKDLIGFSTIHPINIDLQRELDERIKFKDNVPVGWVFKRDPDKDYQGGTLLPLGRVAHLIYNKIGDEILGMSTIEPVFKTAERHLKVEEGIAHGVITYGNPTRDFICGDETHPYTKKMGDAVAGEVKGFNFKGEYIHGPHIRVGQIESFSLGKIPNYIAPFLEAIAGNFEIPYFVLTGKGEGANKATAQVIVDFVYQTIEPLQQAQAMYFEEKILAPLMRLNKVDEVPSIEWNEILPKNLKDYANVIKVLSSVMIGGKQIVTAEECRELAGLGKSVTFKKATGAELSVVRGSPGIYLVKPHGEWIRNRKKKLIVKAKKFPEMVNRALYLVSDNKVFGIIKLKEPVDLTIKEFRGLIKDHLISEDERVKWWPDANKLFAYKFTRLKMFKEPKDFQVPKGVQTFIREVKI